MILQSLCKYYDILNEEGTVSTPGYSHVNVSFSIVIDDDGDLKNIIDMRSGDEKPRPIAMDVPLHKSRSGKNPPPYFLCDNAKYVFGVEKVNKTKSKDESNSSGTILEESDKHLILVNKSTKSRFESFKELHLSILKDVNDEGARALIHFFEKYQPEKFLNNPKIVQYKDQILENANFVFTHNDAYIHQKKHVKKAWEDFYTKSINDEKPLVSQCLISGKTEPIARTHQLIKGVTHAQSAGASIVGFNDKAFFSYGKEQSYNAPISENSMFKYTTALNYLLSESKHRLQIGDSTVVFWADAPEGSYEDFTRFIFYPVETTDEDTKENDPDKRIGDDALLVLLKDVLDAIRNGRDISGVDLGIDKRKMFYVLGLAPNNARLSVRFWYMNEFGDFVEKLSQHYLDMDIEKGDFDLTFAPPYLLINETVPKAKPPERPKPNPILGGLLMRSILNNTPYPIQMYNAILNRVKVEQTMNSVKAGFIKAYLLRLARTGSPYLKEDMITVSLHETSQDVPYRLGRLFAVLEKAQTDTSKGIGSTITSKYFSSASTTPAVVFPVLIKLAQHHIAKSDYGVKTTKDIEEILSEVSQFPLYLNLEEQGMFMLGYYHQKKANYKRKEETEPKKEA